MPDRHSGPDRYAAIGAAVFAFDESGMTVATNRLSLTMNPGEIFHKTARGQAEIATKTDALNMKERRVLILVNGENSVATLAQLSLADDVDAILERLLDGEFIAPFNAGAAASIESDIDVTERDVTEPTPDIGARELMCNTLLAFGNRVRVGDLIQQITDSADLDDLRDLVNPWYDALAETPGGMYQADDLKREVLALIDTEARVAG